MKRKLDRDLPVRRLGLGATGRGVVLGKAIALVGLLLLMGAASASAESINQTFNYTGGEQTFTVPAGVTTLHVVAIGGRGGSSNRSSGGYGATATGDLPVMAGETLYVEVAGNGGSWTEEGVAPGGFNGGGSAGRYYGGGGGGASDIRAAPSSSPDSPATRLLIAAGGGGGGGEFAGAEAGAAPEGSNGGGAGTASSGGAGGSGGGLDGSPGTLGDGGAGGAQTTGADGGGGGGGGLYGGGGGAGGNQGSSGGGNPVFSGAGGGGSSGFAPTVSNTMTGADKTGTPTVTISYEAPSAPAPHAPAPIMSPLPPSLTAVSLTNRHFRVAPEDTALVAKAPLGTSFRFTLSAAAKLQITLTLAALGLHRGHGCLVPDAKLKRQRAKRCTRTITVATFTRAGEPQGADNIAFSGRIGHRALIPGSYKAILSASNTAGRSSPVTLSFTILPQ